MSEPTGRAVANTFLDLVQVWQYGENAIDLAVQELAANGAIQVDFDEETQQLDVNVSQLLVGALALIDPLLTITATNWGLGKDETIARLRQILDDTLT